MRWSIGLLCMVCVGCQPSSLEEFQWEGKKQMELLLHDLQSIETREDLLVAEPALAKRWDKLVEVMIQAMIFVKKNPGQDVSMTNATQMLSASLQGEMERVYRLEGGRECIERVAHEPMLRLHAKEQYLNKR